MVKYIDDAVNFLAYRSLELFYIHTIKEVRGTVLIESFALSVCKEMLQQ